MNGQRHNVEQATRRNVIVGTLAVVIGSLALTGGALGGKTENRTTGDQHQVARIDQQSGAGTLRLVPGAGLAQGVGQSADVGPPLRLPLGGHWIGGLGNGMDAATAEAGRSADRERAAEWVVSVMRGAVATSDGRQVAAIPRVMVPAPAVEAVDEQAIVAAICQYDWPCGDAVAVARCESGLDPEAVSADSANLGIFQLNRVHGEYPGLTENIAVAYLIWRDQGWEPWACRTAIREVR